MHQTHMRDVWAQANALPRVLQKDSYMTLQALQSRHYPDKVTFIRWARLCISL